MRRNIPLSDSVAVCWSTWWLWLMVARAFAGCWQCPSVSVCRGLVVDGCWWLMVVGGWWLLLVDVVGGWWLDVLFLVVAGWWLLLQCCWLLVRQSTDFLLSCLLVRAADKKLFATTWLRQSFSGNIYSTATWTSSYFLIWPIHTANHQVDAEHASKEN